MLLRIEFLVSQMVRENKNNCRKKVDDDEEMQIRCVRERESFRVYKVETGECGTFFHTISFLNDKSGGRGDRLYLFYFYFSFGPFTFCHYHSYPELGTNLIY